MNERLLAGARRHHAADGGGYNETVHHRPESARGESVAEVGYMNDVGYSTNSLPAHFFQLLSQHTHSPPSYVISDTVRPISLAYRKSLGYSIDIVESE